MPLRMPDSTSRRYCNTPSRPQPKGLDWISWAYRGLTVTIESAKTMPVFKRLSLPWNSIWCQLKYFQSRPVKSMSQCQNWPW